MALCHTYSPWNRFFLSFFSSGTFEMLSFHLEQVAWHAVEPVFDKQQKLYNFQRGKLYRKSIYRTVHKLGVKAEVD